MSDLDNHPGMSSDDMPDDQNDDTDDEDDELDFDFSDSVPGGGVHFDEESAKKSINDLFSALGKKSGNPTNTGETIFDQILRQSSEAMHRAAKESIKRITEDDEVITLIAQCVNKIVKSFEDIGWSHEDAMKIACEFALSLSHRV